MKQVTKRITKFISSQRTVDSETQKRIINLGKALVDELGSDAEYNTLTKWMAHYIAEHMTIAECATGEVKKEADVKCFETILKLWEHRSYFPDGKRPFEEFEPIFRVLKRIDPENKMPLYYADYRKSLIESKTVNVEETTQKWLDIAFNIDKTVRIWLDYAFQQAISSATDEKTEMWLKNSLGLQDICNEKMVEAIERLKQEYSSNSDENRKIKKEQLKNQIAKLEAFTEFNQKMVDSLKKELADLSVDDAFEKNERHRK